MASYNMTINLGVDTEGEHRSQNYKTAAVKSGLSLNRWVKLVLDRAVKNESPTITQPLDNPENKI